MQVTNPFVVQGYLSPHYFCDRVEETRYLSQLVTNGNNVALISPRRMGKTGLILHCLNQASIKEAYYTFVVDIYATKNLQEFVFELGRAIMATLKPKGHRAWELFLNCIASLRSTITFDMNGNPEWGLGIGEVKTPATTLDEIFDYLEHAGRPCIVAIDEFQVVANYSDSNIEAVLRTRIQRCRNTTFIYAGSQRHMMSEIFLTPSRPFYQSTMLMSLGQIAQDHYTDFAQNLFGEYQRSITAEAIADVYNRYDGITWYLQAVLNALFAMTERGECCTPEMVGQAIEQVVTQQSFAYASLLHQLPTKQKEVLVAICKEGKAENITSRQFLQKYHLTASSVQAATKGLLEKDFITFDMGVYSPCDRFFAQWLLR